MSGLALFSKRNIITWKYTKQKRNDIKIKERWLFHCSGPFRNHGLWLWIRLQALSSRLKPWTRIMQSHSQNNRWGQASLSRFWSQNRGFEKGHTKKKYSKPFHVIGAWLMIVSVTDIDDVCLSLHESSRPNYRVGRASILGKARTRQCVYTIKDLISSNQKGVPRMNECIV